MDAASDNEAKSILYLPLDGSNRPIGPICWVGKALTLSGKSSKKSKATSPDVFFVKKLGTAGFWNPASGYKGGIWLTGHKL